MSEVELNLRDVIDLLGWRGAGEARRSRRCPDEIALAAYADGALGEGERSRLGVHLADCGHCLGQIGFLARTESLEPWGESPRALLTRAKAAARPRVIVGLLGRWQWQTAFAVLAIAVVVGILGIAWPEERSAGGSSVRGGSRHLVVPNLLRPGEGETVPQVGAELSWQPVPEALYYRVRLVTAGGDLVWEERIEGTVARLPSDVRLAPGERYFAWVRAYQPGGRAIRSTAVGFLAATHSDPRESPSHEEDP